MKILVGKLYFWSVIYWKFWPLKIFTVSQFRWLNITIFKLISEKFADQSICCEMLFKEIFTQPTNAYAQEW